MARPVEIDRTRARRAALDPLWHHGLDGTSMADLLEAMGISSSSFYAAFGSKRELFGLVLEDYVVLSHRAIERADAEGPGLPALLAFLERVIVDRPASERRRGCLLVNSVIELEAADPELHLVVTQHLAALRAPVRRWIEQAVELGHARSDLPSDQLADLVELGLNGLRVASREGASKAELRRGAEALLAVLSATPVGGAAAP